MQGSPLDSNHNNQTDMHIKGGVIIGVFTPILAAVLSWFQTIEGPLRIISLLIGITVGIQALYNGAKKKKRRRD